MSETEIITSFRTAKNPQAQINVLADLNLCAPVEIFNLLYDRGEITGTGLKKKMFSSKYNPVQGVKEPIRRRDPSNPPIDDIRAMELWNEGLDDIAMADALGVKVYRVQKWRYRMHLTRDKGFVQAGKKRKLEAEMRKHKERDTEEQVLAREDEREQLFREIIESCDAGEFKETPSQSEDAAPVGAVENTTEKPIDTIPETPPVKSCEDEGQDTIKALTVGELYDMLQYASPDGRILAGELIVQGCSCVFTKSAGGKVLHKLRLEVADAAHCV